jgi:two-component system, OmpR family, sensor kinase
MIYSLRGRLFIGLTLLMVSTGIGAGLVGFRWAFHEAIEAQDSILNQIGAIGLNTRLPSDAPINAGADAEARVFVEELGDRPSGTPDVRSLWTLKDGLHVVSRDSQPWRILLRTRPDGSRFVIGQTTAIRDEIARGSAFHTILPFAALAPCLMLVIAIVVWQSLRPMIKLAGQLDIRRSDDLGKLSLAGTPRELHPFIASINRLLERIHVMMDQQRRFVADAAHELRTPITAISLQAENLSQTELPPDSRERLAALKSGARRTAHLLEQLLALARSDMDRMPEAPVTSLDRCAKEVVADLMATAADRGVDLGFEIIEPAAVRGEAAMLTSVIRNLLDNALGHTPQGGRVDIGVYREGAKVILQIEDTGPGIPPCDLERIFEPFVRGSRPTEGGTGLGLSIVKRIVERLKASVTLENVPKSGLRATVSFPLVEEGSQRAEAENGVPPAPQLVVPANAGPHNP